MIAGGNGTEFTSTAVLAWAQDQHRLASAARHGCVGAALGFLIAALIRCGYNPKGAGYGPHSARHWGEPRKRLI
jgi:hypothetical protein